MPEDIDPDRMEEIKNSDETWLLDFWAEWCHPCEKYSPIFEEVSEEEEVINFGSVDMEEHQELGTDMGVRALPTTLMIKNGEEVARSAGAMSKKELEKFIEKNR